MEAGHRWYRKFMLLLLLQLLMLMVVLLQLLLLMVVLMVLVLKDLGTDGVTSLDVNRHRRRHVRLETIIVHSQVRHLFLTSNTAGYFIINKSLKYKTMLFLSFSVPLVIV